MTKIRDFYVDESGNTGDLTKAGSAFDFGQQPVFALAAIGVEDCDALARELARLRLVHRIRSPEIKSSIVKDRPAFVRDLVSYLAANDCPILLEIVDKRFFIIATMVNHFVVPPVAAEFDRQPYVVAAKNEIAEYLHSVMPSEIMRAYITACMEPGVESVRGAFNALIGWLESRMPADHAAAFVHKFAIDTVQDFEGEATDGEPDFGAYLPVPDMSKAQKPLWILPNLSSFTNAYARINLLKGRQIGDVRIYHDEQFQLEHIIQDSKRASEEMAKAGPSWSISGADYSFTEIANLTFVASATSVGIQAADVIAGFAMRHVQAIIGGGKKPSREQFESFRSLWRLSDSARGVGVNLVVSRPDFIRLGLMHGPGR